VTNSCEARTIDSSQWECHSLVELSALLVQMQLVCDMETPQFQMVPGIPVLSRLV
jgi:hypothetical protein